MVYTYTHTNTHTHTHTHTPNFLGGSNSKSITCLPVQDTQETRVRSLGWEDPLEEGMATHSSILAWRIAGTEEPGGL